MDGHAVQVVEDRIQVGGGGRKERKVALDLTWPAGGKAGIGTERTRIPVFFPLYHVAQGGRSYRRDTLREEAMGAGDQPWEMRRESHQS